jgi:hypothetical protein
MANASARGRPMAPLVLSCVGRTSTRALTAGWWSESEYDYIALKAFNGIGGAPSANNNVFYTSLRYFPF